MPVDTMRIYRVGGAVRDELLNLPVKDHDYVVVGAKPEQMIAQGFKPVGKDFPVFLHPQTHEEYALARAERKSGHGYKGFTFFASPEVTLIEDLKRRDLTINAIARAQDGTLVDPFNGQQDLADRILRHVGAAFAEDPVRILRIARFSARFTDFSIAPETMALMQQMVAEGEVDYLVAERSWQEISRALMETKPSRMIEVLRQCGALAVLLPELDRCFGIARQTGSHPGIDSGTHTLMTLDLAAERNLDLPVRLAVLLYDLGKRETPSEMPPHCHDHAAYAEKSAQAVCARLKVPAQCREVVLLVTRYHEAIQGVGELCASRLVTLLEKLDALRRPDRFRQIIQACQCNYQGWPGQREAIYPAAKILERALAAIKRVDAASIARQCRHDPSTIPQQLHMARTRAVSAILAQTGERGAT